MREWKMQEWKKQKLKHMEHKFLTVEARIRMCLIANGRQSPRPGLGVIHFDVEADCDSGAQKLRVFILLLYSSYCFYILGSFLMTIKWMRFFHSWLLRFRSNQRYHEQEFKVSRQKAASPTCHPSRLRMNSSDHDSIKYNTLGPHESIPLKRHLDRFTRFCTRLSDVAGNLGRFFVRSVHPKEMILNWF